MARLDRREASDEIESNKTHCIGIVCAWLVVGRDYLGTRLMLLCGW